MKWGEERTFQFVAEYIKHDCLVNSKLYGGCVSKHSFRVARQAAIQKLVDLMNLPDFGTHEALTKIKNIRSTYSQELKKIKEYGDYVPSLKWFKIFDEAVNRLVPRDNFEDSFVEQNDDDEDESSLQNEGIRDPTPEPEEMKVFTDKIIRKRKTCSSERSMNSLCEPPNKIEIYEEKPPQPDSSFFETEFDVFGRSVAAQLNAMPTVLAIRAQAYIQSYLTNVRVENMSNSSQSRMDPLH